MMRWAWLIIFLVSGPGCGTEDPAALRWLVASSTAESARQIADEFEQSTGIAVEVIAASSGSLVRQVENGLQADVALLASSQWMDRLEALLPRAAETRRVPFGNRLVIATRSRTTPRDPISLDGDPPTGRWVIGIPSSVPVGMHGKEALQRLGWWEDVNPRAVRAANSRAAVSHVNSGSVDLGLIWASDTSTQCQILAELPQQLTGAITYPAARLSDRAGSQQLLEALCNSPAWLAAGFTRPPSKESNR
jgi:molybdate transport system substrate-binding protein